MRRSAPSSSVQMREVRVQHLNVARGLDVARRDGAGTATLEHEALDAVALHLDRDVLHVEDDVDDILAHAGDRGELVQHAVDVDRGDRRALQRGQQHPAQRVAERLAEAALERLGDEGRNAAGIVAVGNLEFLRLDKFLPTRGEGSADAAGWQLKPKRRIRCSAVPPNRRSETKRAMTLKPRSATADDQTAGFSV